MYVSVCGKLNSVMMIIVIISCCTWWSVSDFLCGLSVFHIVLPVEIRRTVVIIGIIRELIVVFKLWWRCISQWNHEGYFVVRCFQFVCVRPTVSRCSGKPSRAHSAGGRGERTWPSYTDRVICQAYALRKCISITLRLHRGALDSLKSDG